MMKEDSDFEASIGEELKIIMFGHEVEDGIQQMLSEKTKDLQSADPDPSCRYVLDEISVPSSFDNLGEQMKDGPLRIVVSAKFTRYTRARASTVQLDKHGNLLVGVPSEKEFLVDLTTQETNMGPHVRAAIVDNSLLVSTPDKPDQKQPSTGEQAFTEEFPF